MTDLVGHFLLFGVIAVGFLMVPLLIGRFLRPKLPNPEKDAIYECGEPTIGTSYIQFDLRFYVVALLFIIFDVEVAFFFPWAMVFGGATQLADERLEPDSKARITISEKLLNKEPGTLPKDEVILSGLGGLPDYGLSLKRLADGKGVQVDNVVVDSRAETAGFRAGDHIFKITYGEEGEDDVEIDDARTMLTHLEELSAGSERQITVQRDGKQQILTLMLPLGAYQLALVSLADILVFFGVLLVGFAYVWKRGDLDWVRAVAEKARKSAVFPRPPTTEREPVADTIRT
jgi:NADH:ubiquinone oxidoreductase subunit 3 (subunit A)